MKLNVSLRDDLLQRIDSAAYRMGINRSAFLTMAANQYLNSLTVDGCRDCLTCEHSDIKGDQIVCARFQLAFPVRQLALLCPYPCRSWEKNRKLVNESERTV